MIIIITVIIRTNTNSCITYNASSKPYNFPMANSQCQGLTKCASPSLEQGYDLILCGVHIVEPRGVVLPHPQIGLDHVTGTNLTEPGTAQVVQEGPGVCNKDKWRAINKHHQMLIKKRVCYILSDRNPELDKRFIIIRTSRPRTLPIRIRKNYHFCYHHYHYYIYYHHYCCCFYYQYFHHYYCCFCMLFNGQQK